MIYAILIVLGLFSLTAFFGTKMVEEASKESDNNN
jgi:cytoskeletal protein RodZ